MCASCVRDIYRNMRIGRKTWINKDTYCKAKKNREKKEQSEKKRKRYRKRKRKSDRGREMCYSYLKPEKTSIYM